MVRKILRWLVLVLALGAFAPGAYAETVSRIRLMLHPYAAAPGQLPTLANARLARVTNCYFFADALRDASAAR